MSGPTLAFAGEPGSFGEDAALTYLPGCQTRSVETFDAVFGAVAKGMVESGGVVDGGVVPIENVRQGTVREVYDLLLEHELHIVGEIEVPVRLCLAALPGQAIDDIQRVYSHVQALAQAEAFLRSRKWLLLASATTSSAGSEIALRRERGAAAVLSPRAAALHGLAVLASDIQADERNRTRFLVLAGSAQAEWAQPAASVDRTTIAFAVANEPGALLRVLGLIANRSINMSKLESRPSRQREWEYVFWADLDADLCTVDARPVLAGLHSATSWLRVMGCYPRSAP